MSSYQSWGRYPRVTQQTSSVYWRAEGLPEINTESMLCYGQGRSYGDSCLNADQTLIDTSNLQRLISFDDQSGILKCEAGVTLEQIIQFALPRGWFLPVSPGTKFVSVAGAIANDIHGKNHHREGTFGRHILEFELLRSNGERLICSPGQNAEMFRATIAGLGLTGMISWALLRLKPVKGPYIDMESIKCQNLDEFLEVSADSEKDYEYTVAWLDGTATGRSYGRGIFMRGNHSKRSGTLKPASFLDRIKKVPCDLPGWTLNALSIKAFNALYFNRQISRERSAEVYFEPFFYPLDSIQDWNRIYGKRGFFQFQCVLPKTRDQLELRKVLKKISDSGKASFLSVMKEFSDLKSPGMLSFPREGVTLALDFANQGQATLRMLQELDLLVREAGGAIYPAKDASMSAQSFRQYFPAYREFSGYIDSKFSSSFWRRVNSEDR